MGIFFHMSRSDSYWPIYCILAWAQVRYGVLHSRVCKVGVLFGFEPETSQAGVTSVSVHVWAGSCGIGAGSR